MRVKGIYGARFTFKFDYTQEEAGTLPYEEIERMMKEGEFRRNLYDFLLEVFPEILGILELEELDFDIFAEGSEYE